MHYKLRGGIIIRAENAAKPASQPSKYLTEMLSSLGKVNRSFDFGCGKLRYLNAIRKCTDTLALVDSEIQLSRTQTILGKVTSIRSYLGKSNQVSVYSDTEFQALRTGFDRGFCINVLSTIPIQARRKNVVESIYNSLVPGGECLFVVQYRNSDFDRMKAMPNATAWGDGFIIDSLRGHSYYAQIKPDRLIALVEKGGLSIASRTQNEGSIYLWAKRSK